MLISTGQIQLFVLALTRILMALSRIPMMGGEMIPTQVRIGLGVLLAVVIVPWQDPAMRIEPLGLYPFAVSIGKELLIGALIGFAAGLAFEAVQMAGEVMGLESGFGSGRVFNPVLGEGSPAYVQLFNLTAILLFLVIDGQAQLILALARTFTLQPLLAPLPLNALDVAVSQICQLITAGVQLGLPVLSALLLADLALGLLARVAPHIQVYFLGLPLKIALAFFALGLVFSGLIPLIETLFQNIGPRLLAVLE